MGDVVVRKIVERKFHMHVKHVKLAQPSPQPLEKPVPLDDEHSEEINKLFSKKKS